MAAHNIAGDQSQIGATIIQDLKDGATNLDKRPIMHRILTEKTEEVLTRVSMAPRGTVFVLTGIAGVGVTRVARAVRERYRRDSHPFNPHAAIEVVARAPISSKFGWKKFFASALSALDEPILGQKTRATEALNRVTDYVGTARFRGPEDYRTDLENAMQRRSCRVLSVLHADFFLRRMPPEELHHVLQLFDQMVSVRPYPGVALLSGRPSLLNMIRHDSRGDLCVEVLEIPPLDGNTEEGAMATIEMLKGFEVLLAGILMPGTLVDHAEEISLRTVGATGWVKRAVSQAISDVLLLEEPRALTWSDIKRRLPSKRATEQLHAELKDVADWREYLASGTSKPSVTRAPPRAQPHRRPGERGPSRDEVGGNGD